MSDASSDLGPGRRGWQPGPWSIGDHGVVDAAGKLVFRDPSGPNVQLEVLAPEMADLILRWTSGEGVSVDMIDGISAMGATLRQIGMADA